VICLGYYVRKFFAKKRAAKDSKSKNGNDVKVIIMATQWMKTLKYLFLSSTKVA